MEKQRFNSHITLVSPKNGEEIELTNGEVLKFINGYKKGLSVEHAFIADNYAPDKLRLEWESCADDEKWTVLLSYSEDLSNAFTFETDEKFLEVDCHFIKNKVFWKVLGKQVESQTFNFNLKRLPENIFIEGVVNVRDIGGYSGEGGKRIKRGIIYRGAYVDGITENGKKFANEVLKISTDLDLRNEGEGSADSESSPIGEGVKHILKCGCMYTGNEWSGVEHVGKEGIDIPEGARKLVEELLVFADKTNFPLYTHCVLGRDRTGTLICVLLALCGVSERDIMLDYELSFFSKSGCHEKTEASKIIGYFEKVIDYIKTFEGETLQEKVVSFLKQSGMSDAQMSEIKNNILE